MVDMVLFGDCGIDISARLLERGGEEQHLEPQAFDLLAYLVTHADRVIPKTELLDEVWGDQFVSESALTTRIKEVRQAVGDDGTRQAVVKNYRGRGYRFIAETSTAESAPAAGLSRRRSNASLSTTLIGRDEDLAECVALLDDSRVVTLVGPGGVGKTTLAREVARTVRDDYRDGVITVRLAPVEDAASVIHVLRNDAGLAEAPADEETLATILGELQALIILDNCEHVLRESARLTDRIVSGGGNARVIATSRERLGISCEHVWPVAPLDDRAAQELLRARVQSASPGYEFPADVGCSIGRILEAVDRLPLAIEMAAARLPTLGVDDLEALLTNRLELLRSADRTSADRHRTLDALIAWSEDLLAEEERDLLAAMSVFAGPVAAADIAAVVGLDVAELATGPLAGLVDKSLVVADTARQPTRYQLLETVRARASQRLPAHLEARHAGYFTDLATSCDRQLRTEDEAAAAARLDALRAEARAAHRWARDHDASLAAALTTGLWHYSFERQWTEPAVWAAELATRLDPADPAMVAVDVALAADASNRGDYERASSLAQAGLTSSDPRVRGAAHDTLGNIGLYLGDLAAAHHHTSALIELGETNDDPAFTASGQTGRLLYYVYGGELDEARRVLETADWPRHPSPTGQAWIAYATGELHSASGDHEAAIEQFGQAIELGGSVGNRFVVSVSQVSSLAAATRGSDPRRSVEAFLPVLERYRRIRSFTHAVTTIRNLIDVLARTDNHETAMVLLGGVSNPVVKLTYGAESDRLNEARSLAVEAHGTTVVERWLEEGASYDVARTVDVAIAAVAEIAALSA